MNNFRHFKLEFALAVWASKKWKIETNNYAAQGLNMLLAIDQSVAVVKFLQDACACFSLSSRFTAWPTQPDKFKLKRSSGTMEILDMWNQTAPVLQSLLRMGGVKLWGLIAMRVSQPNVL